METSNHSLLATLVERPVAPGEGKVDFTTAMGQLGFTSVFDIVELPKDEFIRQLALYNDDDGAHAYENALSYTTQLQWLYYHAPAASTRDKRELETNVASPLKEDWGNACHPDAIDAIDSPVAYLRALFLFATQLENNGKGPKDKILLSERRPDLKTLLIDHDTTFTQRPLLTLIDDMLHKQVQLHHPKAELHTLLSQQRYPLTLPYHHHHLQCRLGLSGTRHALGELNYRVSKRLTAVHEQAVDAQGPLTRLPPQEYLYQASSLKLDIRRYQRFDDLPGLNDGQRYQLVDLYGEGLPGILYRGDQAWYYRAPQRAEASTGDAVTYAPAQALPDIPVSDGSRPVYQALLDIDGDGRPEWVLARPGMGGFFNLAPPANEAGFIPFDAFPIEFLHADALFADLMGSGLGDLALVGPRSVRFYPNRQNGFGPGVEQAHTIDGDDLPSFTRSSADWVGFSDILGSGQQHLVRIRFNEIKCWPNLGLGRFGKGQVLATLPFRETTFNAANVLLADLDGCGASDLLYLTTEGVSIYLNQAGNRFARTPLVLPWPSGAQYDSLCQVSVVDLLGNGYASLIISTLHPRPRHWRYAFFDSKPCLLSIANNNLGAQVNVSYRSSAQEWLDEKKQHHAEGKPAISGLAIHRQLQQPIILSRVFRQPDDTVAHPLGLRQTAGVVNALVHQHLTRSVLEGQRDLLQPALLPIAPMPAIALCVYLLQQRPQGIIVPGRDMGFGLQLLGLCVITRWPVNWHSIDTKPSSLLDDAPTDPVLIHHHHTGRVCMADQPTTAVTGRRRGLGCRIGQALDTTRPRFLRSLFKYCHRAK